jgi:hypothetical protein
MKSSSIILLIQLSISISISQASLEPPSFSKRIKYNEDLINQGFMALEHYFISEGNQTPFASHEEELKQKVDQEITENTQKEDQTDKSNESMDYFITIYGKVETKDEIRFLSESFMSMENFNIRHYPKEDPELMDVSFLKTDDQFEITLTNNLIFKYIIAPNVYHIRLEFSENDCMTPFVFYDDSSETQITFDEKLNMLHILHEEGHVNYYLEEIRNYSDFSQYQVITLKNPYFSNKENIYVNIICPFWKYTDVNKIRGKGSFKFWDSLEIFKGTKNVFFKKKPSSL